MPKLKKVKKCEPDCPYGLDVFNDLWNISGSLWVEIERCDECSLYEGDEDAALVVAAASGTIAFYLDTETEDMHPIPLMGFEEDADFWIFAGFRIEEGRIVRQARALRCVVTAEAAEKAGLINLKALKRESGL